MGNNLAVDVAYAASALARVAVTPELEVYERAVTLADLRGRVCPTTGGSSLRAFTWHGSDLSAQYGPSAQRRINRSDIAASTSAITGASSVMNNVQFGKPRTGYCAMSGTG